MSWWIFQYRKALALQSTVLQLNLPSSSSLQLGKIATLAYQSLAFGQPTYLSSVLTPHQPQWSLRSVNQNLLSVPRCNSSFGQRTFPTVALESETTYHCNARLVYWHIWPNVLRNWSIYHTRSSWSKEQSFDQMHSTFGQTVHIVPGPTEQLLCYSVDY